MYTEGIAPSRYLFARQEKWKRSYLKNAMMWKQGMSSISQAEEVGAELTQPYHHSSQPQQQQQQYQLPTQNVEKMYMCLLRELLDTIIINLRHQAITLQRQ